MYDGNGNEMPNPLPSTPKIPYNLHDGVPVVTSIDPASPDDDLHQIVFALEDMLVSGDIDWQVMEKQTQLAIDILEGNPVDGRAYSGFPLLHYIGPNKLKQVDAESRTVKVHQIWYGEHIESDTSFIDPSAVLEDTWIIEYTIDVLNRGEDDFSPFVTYTDDPVLQNPQGKPLPHIGMDQTFFPMQQGTRTVFRIKMSRGKYFNLSYAWGWRVHPPRIQAIENSRKCFSIPDAANPHGNDSTCIPLHEWEVSVFGRNPTLNKQTKELAISKIGDLSPAKIMWVQFRSLLQQLGAAQSRDVDSMNKSLKTAKAAYFDWRTRTRLPGNLEVDGESDITLLYVNNTIYGEFSTHGKPLQFPEVRWPDWKRRDDSTLKVMIHNNDNFQHAYANVDFGGARGWENQFKSSVKVGGSGCWFTFGRAHWMPNIKPIVLPAKPDMDGATSKHKVHLSFNYEPSTRLRFYQYDPMHHDVAIYSIH
jgi:hypothetical protein